MATKLFVGGIAWATTDDSLKAYFSQYGTVVSATVITDKYTGKSKGFGFVEMSTEEEAQKALAANGTKLDDREITVNEARPMVPREDRGGSRSFSGGGRNDDRRGGGRDFRRNSN